MMRLRMLAALALLTAAAPATTAPAETAIAAKVAATPSFKSLDDKVGCGQGRAPETVFLTVANEGGSDLRLTSVTLRAPRDLELCGGRALDGGAAMVLARNDIVPAGRREVVAIPVGARERLRSGTYPLVLEVEVEDVAPGSSRRDRLLATGEVQLQIQGLTDVLKVLGVPTLFLLPGFLVLVAFAAFRSGDWENATKPTNPAFWIIAVPFSMGLSFLFTAALGSGDFSEPFNLGDVAGVWLISLVIGTLAGVATRIWQKSQARRASEKSGLDLAGRTIGGGNSPLVVLKTLGRLDTKWPPGWHQSGGHSGFLVGPDAADKRWLIPQVQLTGERPNSIPQADWLQLQQDFDLLLNGAVTADRSLSSLKGSFSPASPRLAGRFGTLPARRAGKPRPSGARNFIFRE